MIEDTLTIGAGEWAVGGTLSKPRGVVRPPVLVMLHGSGPGPRDGHIGGVRDLAWRLGQRGVAVLRFDKRITAHRARFAALGRPATIEEEALDDAVSAIRLVRSRADLDSSRIAVLGPSQGSGYAPTAARLAGGVRGLALVSVSARPAGRMIIDQVDYLQSLSSDSADRARGDATRREAIRLLDPGTPDSAMVLGRRVGDWRALEKLDPMRETLAHLDAGGWLLVVHGGRDYLVTDEDFSIWQRRLAGRPGATTRRLPALNHMMQAGEGRMTPAEYRWRTAVAEEYVDVIATWIESFSR